MKQHRWVTIYRCFDNGKLVCKGTKKEVAEFIKEPRIMGLGRFADGKPHFGRYVFEPVGRKRIYIELNESKEDTSKPDRDFDERFNIAYQHLLRDGVTCLADRDKAEVFIPLLKEKGLVCTSRKGKEVSGFRKVKYYDILEVVK